MPIVDQTYKVSSFKTNSTFCLAKGYTIQECSCCAECKCSLQIWCAVCKGTGLVKSSYTNYEPYFYPTYPTVYPNMYPVSPSYPSITYC